MVKQNWPKINFGGLRVLFLALVTVPLVLFLLTCSGNLNLAKKATGSGSVKISLSSDKNSLRQTESVVVRVMLTVNSNQQIRVAGADISFNPDVFSVSAITCASNFSSVAKAQVSGNKVLLSCFRPGGSSPLIIAPASPIVLGSFKLTAKPGAVLGASTISFLRTNIPEAVSTADLADSGTGQSISVVQGDSTCLLKTEGDANCDGLVNFSDFFVWRGEFIARSGTEADFDQDGSIGIRDFFLWRSSFIRSVL